MIEATREPDAHAQDAQEGAFLARLTTISPYYVDAHARVHIARASRRGQSVDRPRA
jgi:hypothetical protein